MYAGLIDDAPALLMMKMLPSVCWNDDGVPGGTVVAVDSGRILVFGGVTPCVSRKGRVPSDPGASSAIGGSGPPLPGLG